MSLLVNLAFATMLVALTATGVRLLLAARRTRGVPEFTIGVGTLGGAVGGAVETASIRFLEAGGDPQTAFLVQAAARLIYMASATFLLVAFWKIYHPSRPWARALALGGSLALLASAGLWIQGGVHSMVSGLDARGLLFQLARAAVYLWGVASGLWYWGRLRRQLRLGLGDPVITTQFLLWSVASAAAIGIIATILAYQIVWEMTPLDSRAGMAWLALFGFAAGATLYVAFFPPAPYRRWVGARAAAAPGA
jgi:hypothetical protein